MFNYNRCIVLKSSLKKKRIGRRFRQIANSHNIAISNFTKYSLNSHLFALSSRSTCRSEGGFIQSLEAPPFSSGRDLTYVDEEPHSPTSNGPTSGNGGLYDTPPYSTSHSPTSQVVEEDDLATIILHPDHDGKYGFKVCGIIFFHLFIKKRG